MGYDRKKGEVIIIGTGIGFRAKKGDQVDESKIQKMFTDRSSCSMRISRSIRI